jgi:hypothetical protein
MTCSVPSRPGRAASDVKRATDPFLAARERLFGPRHRTIGPAPLTDFRFDTQDRLVERTVFAASIELTADMDAVDWGEIPPLCVRDHGIVDR